MPIVSIAPGRNITSGGIIIWIGSTEMPRDATQNTAPDTSAAAATGVGTASSVRS